MILITFALFLTTGAWASQPSVYTGLLSDTGAGGYDTWAVAQGYLAKGDPQHWAIRDGRLYLNYNQSVQNRWLEDTRGFIRQADANWPKVLE
ncbi:hypothetical protein [Marinobacter sp. LV10R520-4]|uniref:hypothetical protein n=1 Tax=Marinobacter sp. LV10R520-4 TaxID=1761796 RepID=UPI001E61BEDD|nr:hypothetical protein [Marinobacter sp. LV10R520-4]